MTSQILENRFEIESQLSCTDFSTVYLACDRRHPHRPACLITAIAYHQREIRHRLEREAQLLERLGRHPQIPRVLAYFHKSTQAQPNGGHSENQPLGTFYLVQDYIEGHPLSEEITPPRRLSESYVNQLLKDVLVALTFAHEQGLVHQNLHPQHLIREARDGQIWVTQFGAIAKIARSKLLPDGRLGCSVPVSPHPYTAPELLRAATTDEGERSLQPASDLYSLGLIAIEALTGQRHQYFNYDPQCGLQWRTEAVVSIPLAEFINRLIRQDWRDRFPNAQEALATLKAQSDRDRVAKDSRLPTVVAAPGTPDRKPNRKSPAQNWTQASTAQLTGTQSAKKALSPTFFKFVIGSVALVLALGLGVKAYQWGEYQFSLLPKMWSQSWQNWRWQGPAWGGSPKSAYAAADPKALTPLLADGSILLQPAAATAFWQMVVAAQSDGIALYPLAGYDPANKSGRDSSRNSNNDYATGYAIDITTGDRADLDRKPSFADTPAFQWLNRNAQSYGFQLSSSNDRLLGGAFKEPWHWRYIGDDGSRKVFNR